MSWRNEIQNMKLQCSHCQSTIMLDDTAGREAVCTSCGASLQLDPDVTADWRPRHALTRLGRFEILEQLGIGGYGIVYKARDTELDRLVAVKIPLNDRFSQPEDRVRFLREAKSAAQLKHPGIVSLYDATFIDGACCLVSEFIPGSTLAEWLTAKRLSFHRTAELMANVADALHYAHQNGVVHRDIKPSNIMLDMEGKPHVMDFGLAKRAADDSKMTLEGQIVGTPAYMSPEQAKGEVSNVDARSDVYGLGVILYEMLSGELPFRGQKRMLLVQVIQDEPRPPRRLNDRIPLDLETICLKAMAKEPARRYPTAQEMADDLRRFLSGEPIRARRVGRVERFWRWCRRNPLVASLTAAVAVLLVAGSTIATCLAIDATVARNRADAKAIEAQANARQALREKQRADRKALEAETNAAEAHASLYAVRMNMIQLAWDNANLPLVSELLELVRQGQPKQKDLRGWEWRYFQRLCHQEQAKVTIQPDADSVESLAFSPDGQRIVTAGNQVKVWDAATQSELLVVKNQGFINSVAFSPDGRRIATAGDQVGVWDASTGQNLLALEHPGPSKSVAFSPDGKHLAFPCGDRQIRVCDAVSGKELNAFIGHSDEVLCVAFSPDGKWLASTSKDKTVRLWDTSDAREVFSLQGHLGDVLTVAFRPDGLQLASGGGDSDPSIRLWDVLTGQLLQTLTGHTRRIYAIAFSPDGLLLASGSSDDTAKIWDPDSGAELETYRGHETGVHSLAFSPDGFRLATGSSDETVHLLDVRRERQPRVLSGHTDQVRAVQFTGDGRRLVSVGLDGKINTWNLVTGQMEPLFPKAPIGILGMAVSADSRYLATAGNFGQVAVWDLTSGKLLWQEKGHPTWASAVAFSADGRFLASGGARNYDNRQEPILIKLWEASTGKEVRNFQGHDGEVTGLAFTPEGSQLISGSSDSTIKIWDVAKGAELKTLQGHDRGITSIALHGDANLLVTASSDQTVRLWDLAKGRQIRTLLGHFDAAWSVAFHPDGKRIATAGFDETVRVWDVATGLELANLKGHSDRVLGVAFSPEGDYLASAGGIDLTVRVWDARELTAESRLEDDAARLVAALFAKPLAKNDVLAAIRRNRSIDESQRERALQLAELFLEETDAKKYHDAAWPLIRHPNSNVYMCQFALSQLSSACQQEPTHTGYRIALGVAQYRLGRFEKKRYDEALATLTACDQQQPATLAFLAMTQHQLGRVEPSQATLARLSPIMNEPKWASNHEAKAFQREAAALTGSWPTPSQP